MDLADSIVALNLLEASQLSDVLKERLGISDAVMMPQMGMGAPAAAGGAAEEEVNRNLVLLSEIDKDWHAGQ